MQGSENVSNKQGEAKQFMLQSVILIAVLILAGLLGFFFVSRFSRSISRKKNSGQFKGTNSQKNDNDVWSERKS